MSGHARHLRKPLLMASAAVLGASLVVLPALASSEATINAYSYGEKVNYWQPNTAAVESGGVVKFNNATGVNHGVEWKSALKPKCTGVPETVANSTGGWHGSCTFTEPGTYTFWCTIHLEKMTGTITVTAAGTTTGTITPTTAGSTASAPPPAGGGGQGGPSPSTAPSESPLAGSAASAVRIASSQHGAMVRGAVNISPAGEGGSLEVDALAKSAGLASSGHGGRVRVGRLVLSHLHPGTTTFSVRLTSRARSALRRHRRLGLSLRIVVTPLGGSPLVITRSVIIRL